MAVEKIGVEEMRIVASTELDRVLRDHSRRRREFEREHQDPAILYVGLLVVSILFGVSWWMLDRMRCDFFYSDIPLSSHRYTCR
jgi:hypothetical protein